MKKLFLFLCVFSIFIPQVSFASDTTIGAKKIIISNHDHDITRAEAFKFLSDYYSEEIPETYKYINLNFIDVYKGQEIYNSLQKLVYLDLIKNNSLRVYPNKNINAYRFYGLAKLILKTDFIWVEDVNTLKSRLATKADFAKINMYFDNSLVDFENITSNEYKVKQKRAIFVDVYDSLISNHFDSESIDEEKIIESAIEWLASWVGDKYTVYFPPTDSKDFYESLSWEYEWIWSYVDMETPWAVRIVSPIPWSPSEKAWLKWWDLIIKVNGKEITKENSLKEVVSWIKWPAWTKVVLTINRNGEILEIEVERAKITIKDVEYELLDRSTFLISIKSFWDHVSSWFKEAIEKLNTNNNVKRVIIDLRNNGWGYLWEVSNILSYFIDVWEPTAVVKYKLSSRTYNSLWYDIIDFSNYTIVILQNSWTASASEIMAWTIKDYYPNATIIWEKSFGKWSVQTLKSYKDWSSLKYTIAKWFTWKKEIWIDWVWITPDIELEFDLERYQKYGKDNQLERAKLVR